jgi:hypothetical protein
VGIGGKFPHLGRRALNTLLSSAMSYLYETGFSAVVAIKTKYCSMMNLKITLEWPFQNSNISMISYVEKGNHIHPINRGMRSIFLIQSFKLNALNNT